MIIIGSRALYSRFKDQYSIERVNKADYDVIMSYDDFNNWITKFNDYIIDMIPKSHNKYNIKIIINGKKNQFEIELGLENTSAKFLLDNIDDVCDLNYIDNNNTEWKCLSLPYLMLMKKSHLNFPVHFEKNILDYHFLNEIIGSFELNENMKSFFCLRKNEADLRFKDKHSTPSLNMTNDKFFGVSGKAVGRVYIHDDLHDIVKHFNVPVYDMLKSEDKKESAWCDKDLFKNLPYDYRVKCVQEESYVIALERYIIPKLGKYEDFFWCYKRALMRICTTLCSGFFREFAQENYVNILDSYSEEFYNKFIYAKENNIIKPMEHLRNNNV